MYANAAKSLQTAQCAKLECSNDDDYYKKYFTLSEKEAAGTKRGRVERPKHGRSSLGFSTRAYKVLLSLAFLLLCSIITILVVTYSTFYSTSSSAERLSRQGQHQIHF